MDMTNVATSGCALYAIEIPGTGERDAPPRLLMRGTDDPFTFTTRESARTVASACGVPGAEVVGLVVRHLAASKPERTPWQQDRDYAERTGTWPEASRHYHRHFASDAVHRDGGPECDQPGTPRRVYVFDPGFLHEHEVLVARYAAAHPDEFCEEI